MTSDPNHTTTAATAGIRAQLAAVRAQRIADQLQATQLAPLMLAIAVTRAERDAGSSPQLNAHRAYLDQIWADVEQLGVAWSRVTIRAQQADSDDPARRQAHRALDAAEQALRTIAAAVNT